MYKNFFLGGGVRGAFFNKKSKFKKKKKVFWKKGEGVRRGEWG